MDDLTYTLRQLCQRNRDGSHNTQADRMRSLALAARQLREAGFRQMKASSLKGKHVQALLDRWQGEGLSSGTLKNRLSHLRWWAEKIGKSGILPADNTQLGVSERRYVTNVSKARELGSGLDLVTDAHVRMSLKLQAVFGLRREEAIKFQPSYADRGDHLALKGSWTKGGRERTVPITTPAPLHQSADFRRSPRESASPCHTRTFPLFDVLPWSIAIRLQPGLLSPQTSPFLRARLIPDC